MPFGAIVRLLFPITDWQHLKEQSLSVEYFVIGCAAKLNTSQHHKDSVPEGSSLFYWADPNKDGGFAVALAGVFNMTFQFIDAHGSILYSRNLYPRNIQARS